MISQEKCCMKKHRLAAKAAALSLSVLLTACALPTAGAANAERSYREQEVTADYSKLYDIQAVSEFLSKQPAPTKPAQTATADTQQATQSGVPVGVIVLIAAAAAVLVAVVIVLIVRRKKVRG